MNRIRMNGGTFLKLMVVFLVIAMVIGTVPVSAKSKKTSKIPTVEVSSKKQLVNQFKTDGEAKIIFTTDKAVSITIPSEPYSSQKHLVIRAANASITNKAKFASVSIEAVKYYTEKTSGNEIIVTADGAWINVYNRKKVAKLTIDAANVEISVKKKATIEDLTIKHKAGSNVRLEATNDSKVNANLTKKTNLTVTGVKSADVNIVSSYKNNTVRAYIPVDITASKKMKLETNAGSEGTTVDRTKSSVKVSITDKSKKAPTITVAGKAQTIPTPKPTATATPKPTATAAPTTTTAPTSGGEIYGYGGGSSSGGSSSGGYSGGSSSGGYSGGSSSGGYSGGSSSDGSSSGGEYTPAPTADPVTPAPVTPTAEPSNPVTPTEEVTPSQEPSPSPKVETSDVLIEINATNFPDDIFRKFVSDNFDTDHNGSLDDEEISAVVEINCTPSKYAEMGINREDYEDEDDYYDALEYAEYEYWVAGNGIRSFKGIEFFTGLEVIDSWCNYVSELDLSKNTKLKEVYFSDSNLESIDVSECKKLIRISVYGNRLSAIDVTQNESLVYLGVGNNEIQTLDVSHNTLLTQLSCARNELSSLDVSNNSLLEYLWCEENAIEILDLSHNPELTQLYCNKNKITELDISATKLTRNHIQCDKTVLVKPSTGYTETIENDGLVIVNEYDATGSKVKSTWSYASGNIYTYYYNNKGQVEKEESYDSLYDSTTTFEYEYDDAGKKTKYTQVNTDGSRYEHIYDDWGREIKFIQKFLNEDGSYTVRFEHSYEYNDKNQQTKVIETQFYGEKAETYITEYAYNNNNDVIKKSVTTPEGYTSVLENVYNEDNNQITKVIETDSDGTITEYIWEYDENGKRIRYTRQPGSGTRNGVFMFQIFVCSLGETGYLESEISYMGGEFDYKTEYTYDQTGKCICQTITYPNGKITTRALNSDGTWQVTESTESGMILLDKADLDSAQVGNIVTFGSYEQDNDISDGKEPIEWIVLSRDGNKLFLFSRYILDFIPYHEVDDNIRFSDDWEYEDVTWETCTLRSWLNGEFYQNAFSMVEKERIKKSLIQTADNRAADGGNDTEDRLFLLSIEDIANPEFKLYVSQDILKASATDYAETHVGMHCTSGETGESVPVWWLRSPARSNNKGTASVAFDVTKGGEDYTGSMGFYCETLRGYQGYGVRPAMFIDLDASETVDPIEPSQAVDIGVADAGDIVLFGNYEQDYDIADGKEPIEWIVLSKNDSEILLLSKYALDSKPYNENDEDTTWEKCSLRLWLNEDFYDMAFSNEEKNIIKETTLSNDTPGYHDGGNDTIDKVFLLSYYDLINSDYGFSTDEDYPDIIRRCSATPYSIANGTSTFAKYKTADNKNTCWWWLRTTGYFGNGDAATVYGSGRVNKVGCYVDNNGGVDDTIYGVRPAIILSLE